MSDSPPRSDRLPTSPKWQVEAFDALSNQQIYALLSARSRIFVVEQHCVYQDLDGLDWDACHVLAVDETGPGQALVAYARLSPPDGDEGDVRIGRVLVAPERRGQGLGAELMSRAVAALHERWPASAIRLHAQAHLTRFYGAFGFEPLSEPHDHDGIPHVWMRRPARIAVTVRP